MFDYQMWKQELLSGPAQTNYNMAPCRLLSSSELFAGNVEEMMLEIDRDIRSAGEFTRAEIKRDPILAGMLEDNIELTRANYIERTYGQIPDEWSAEFESELPERLQDWSQFEA